MLILILLASCSLHSQQTTCDEYHFTHHNSLSIDDYYDWYLGNNIIQCDETLIYIIDFNLDYVSDKIMIFIDDTIRWESDWLGGDGINGFIQYTLHNNNAISTYEANSIKTPNDFAFEDGNAMFRVRIVTKSRNVWLRILPNEYESSNFEWFMKCKFENRLLDIDTVYTCYEPVQAREVKLVANCDTIIIDSIDVSTLGLENVVYDSVPSSYYDEIVLNTTYNEYGCIIASKIRIFYIDSIKLSYIPNVFSPNGDGTNDFFFATTGDISHDNNIYYRIFNRSGMLLYEGSGGWNGQYKGVYVLPDVYTYFITLYNTNYRGTITVIR